MPGLDGGESQSDNFQDDVPKSVLKQREAALQSYLAEAGALQEKINEAKVELGKVNDEIAARQDYLTGEYARRVDSLGVDIQKQQSILDDLEQIMVDLNDQIDARRSERDKISLDFSAREAALDKRNELLEAKGNELKNRILGLEKDKADFAAAVTLANAEANERESNLEAKTEAQDIREAQLETAAELAARKAGDQAMLQIKLDEGLRTLSEGQAALAQAIADAQPLLAQAEQVKTDLVKIAEGTKENNDWAERLQVQEDEQNQMHILLTKKSAELTRKDRLISDGVTKL